MYGTEGDDYIKGTRLAESIHAGAGDDEIHANDGDDIIHAGAGDDEIHANDGDDIIHAGAGDDEIHADGGNDEIYAGIGNDTISGSYQGNNTLNGGEGDDVLQLSSVSSYYKDSDNHLLTGSDGNILINILDENDASNNGSITLKRAYINNLNHIELIEFSSDSSGSSNMDASAILAPQ
ncbi:calcium-binding protein [Vibrio lentus]|uniref:calcium-binding protein n=1 Tax=Vibrio lentus TaxID=136468 RepID=UPI0038B23640